MLATLRAWPGAHQNSVRAVGRGGLRRRRGGIGDAVPLVASSEDSPGLCRSSASVAARPLKSSSCAGRAGISLTHTRVTRWMWARGPMCLTRTALPAYWRAGQADADVQGAPSAPAAPARRRRPWPRPSGRRTSACRGPPCSGRPGGAARPQCAGSRAQPRRSRGRAGCRPGRRQTWPGPNPSARPPIEHGPAAIGHQAARPGAVAGGRAGIRSSTGDLHNLHPQPTHLR